MMLFPAPFSENDEICCHPPALSGRYQQGWRVPSSVNLNPKTTAVSALSPQPSFSTHLKGHGQGLPNVLYTLCVNACFYLIYI